MIDWEKSAELNDCSIGDLKVRFKRFPSSNKHIIAICDICYKEREISFYQYYDLCHGCSKNTLEYKEKVSKLAIDYWADQSNRDAASERTTRYFEINPEAKLKNSDAQKSASEKRLGGNDIVEHHIAYDFLRLDELIVEVTRSFHGQIHHPKGIPITKRGYSLID